MKRKHPNSFKKVNSKTKISNRKDNKRILIFIGGILIMYFFHMKSINKIINYPNWINYSLFGAFLILITAYKFKFLKNETFNFTFKNRIFFFIFSIFQYAIISWFITGIFLIPFDYYLINYSKKENLETLYCEIKGISTHARNRTVFYSLNNRTNVIYDYKPIMEDIKSHGKFRNYWFVVDARKSLFKSYVIESWDIEMK